MFSEIFYVNLLESTSMCAQVLPGIKISTFGIWISPYPTTVEPSLGVVVEVKKTYRKGILHLRF